MCSDNVRVLLFFKVQTHLIYLYGFWYCGITEKNVQSVDPFFSMCFMITEITVYIFPMGFSSLVRFDSLGFLNGVNTDV